MKDSSGIRMQLREDLLRLFGLLRVGFNPNGQRLLCTELLTLWLWQHQQLSCMGSKACEVVFFLQCI